MAAGARDRGAVSDAGAAGMDFLVEGRLSGFGRRRR
jgi:hypothetical protein